jgi:hypothetical protein
LSYLYLHFRALTAKKRSLYSFDRGLVKTLVQNRMIDTQMTMENNDNEIASHTGVLPFRIRDIGDRKCHTDQPPPASKAAQIKATIAECISETILCSHAWSRLGALPCFASLKTTPSAYHAPNP